MSDQESSYALRVRFGKSPLCAAISADNTDEYYRRHFTPEEQKQIHALLWPYIKWGDVTGFYYEIGPKRNLLTVQQRPPSHNYSSSDNPGILWLAKVGEKGAAPRYEINYGLGRQGDHTCNFLKALQFCRLHLEERFSGLVQVPPAQVLTLT